MTDSAISVKEMLAKLSALIKAHPPIPEIVTSKYIVDSVGNPQKEAYKIGNKVYVHPDTLKEEMEKYNGSRPKI